MEFNPPYPGPTKEAKLLDLLSYYRPIEVLHSTVEEMCHNSAFKTHFQKVLQHDLKAIKRRSQDLDDHEVSLTQKAFVVLMEEGDHIAGIEIYVEEIIGLKVVEEKEKLQTLKLSVKTKGTMLKKFQSGQGQKSSPLPGSSSSRRARNQRHVSETLFVSDGSEHGEPQAQQDPAVELGASEKLSVVDHHGDPALKPSDKDSKFGRLWNLYKTAKDDYRKTRKTTIGRTEAAKFLRDTTENCVLYIEAKQHAPNDQTYEEPKLRELRVTLKEAIGEAEKGSGGKRRRFDEDWAHIPTAPKQMRGDDPKELMESLNPNQNTFKPPAKTLPPPRGSYGRLRTAPMSRYHEQRQAQINRRRSASPGRYSGAPRQVSVREPSRDLRRQGIPPGYYDTYRPRY